MAIYTHNFEIKFDGLTVSGEIEFNVDGQVSYKLEDEPDLPLKTIQIINSVFDNLKELYKLQGGMEKFEIIEKQV